MIEGMKKETIHHESNKKGGLCLCGNADTAQGFYACDAQGNPLERDASQIRAFYGCNQCGRILSIETLEVVGLHPELASTAVSA